MWASAAKSTKNVFLAEGPCPGATEKKDPCVAPFPSHLGRGVSAPPEWTAVSPLAGKCWGLGDWNRPLFRWSIPRAKAKLRGSLAAGLGALPFPWSPVEGSRKHGGALCRQQGV